MGRIKKADSKCTELSVNFVIAQVEKKWADVPVDLYLKYEEFIYSDN